MLMKLTRSRILLRSAGLALSSAAVLLTGCALQQTASEGNSAGGAAVISGKAMGGQQPIYNATVTLYAAGSTDYGSVATRLASTSTDINGQFSFHPATGVTYSCPATNSATASQYLYLIASGGQPTPGVTNQYSAEMIALGNCSTVLATNPQVVISEETTIASMFALQQFFAPLAAGLGNVGAPASNLSGLANAMATANNLVNSTSGQSGVSTVSGAVAGYSTNPVVTITPEITKINLEADILASCINSNPATSTNCNTLFSNVSATPAADTLQAAYYLATNPTSTVNSTSNIATIFGLAASNPPFTPTAAQPADWTLGITYGSNSSQAVGSTTVYLLTEPEYLAIDGSGNVWAVSYSGSAASTAGNSLTELSPLGVPLTQALTAATALAAPRNIAIDPSNNVYVGSYGAAGAGKQVSEYTAAGGTNTFTLQVAGPDALASDGTGNIFVATYGGAAGSGDLEVIPAGSGSGTTATSVSTAVSVGTYSSIALDSHDTAWLTNNTSNATTQFLCTYTSGVPSSCSGTSTTAGGQTGSQSVAINKANDIFIGNYSATAGGGSVAEIAPTTTTTITGVSGSPFSGGGAQNPTRSIVDGLGNVWFTNYASGAGSVSEFTSAGVPISPSYASATAVGGFAHTYAGAEGIAIDGSGNVWIGNASAGAKASATNNGYITEIVGQAGPVVTPLAAGLPTTPGGTSRLGTRP